MGDLFNLSPEATMYIVCGVMVFQTLIHIIYIVGEKTTARVLLWFLCKVLAFAIVGQIFFEVLDEKDITVVCIGPILLECCFYCIEFFVDRLNEKKKATTQSIVKAATSVETPVEESEDTTEEAENTTDDSGYTESEDESGEVETSESEDTEEN